MENIVKEIERLKREKNAVILAHYYTTPEIQALADYVGDSFALARTAKSSSADVVVFCGVKFMGESAKILCPDKSVLMPDPTADCAMAHMATIEKIREMRSKYDDLAVVCYINSTAELKCHTDVCVTSSNAVKIVKNLPNKNIFFIPDGNLGRYVAEQVPEKNVMLNDGCCPIHAAVTLAQLNGVKAQYPNAKVLTHPECVREVVEASDYVGSTAGILQYAIDSECGEFIICTEEGIAYELGRQCPGKKFHFIGSDFVCADMKLNTPEKLLRVLVTGENEIFVDEKTAELAMKPLDRMLEMAK